MLPDKDFIRDWLCEPLRLCDALRLRLRLSDWLRQKDRLRERDQLCEATRETLLVRDSWACDAVALLLRLRDSTAWLAVRLRDSCAALADALIL